MKEGYIVWNLSTCDCEFFGVYRSWDKALRQFRKVVRNRYGKCPRDYDDILDFLSEAEGLGDDSLRITKFEENDASYGR